MEKKKLSERTWWMVLWLILFFPVGLYLLWAKHPDMKKSTKIIITAIVAGLVIYGMAAPSSTKQESTDTEVAAEKTTSQKEETTTKAKEETTEKAAETSTEKLKSKEEIEKELEGVKGKEVKDTIDKFNATGYKIKYKSNGEDFTKKINDVNDMVINDYDIDEDDKTITVDILSKDDYEFNQVNEMGRMWFQKTDWDNVFKYKSDVHYIIGYSCQKTNKDLEKYGKYVAISSADLQNQYGAEFKSNVYIFMDEKGIVKHIFYDEADGSSRELDLDKVPMNF